MSLWYQQPAEYRKTKKPDEIAEEIKKAKYPPRPTTTGTGPPSVAKIKERLRESRRGRSTSPRSRRRRSTG